MAQIYYELIRDYTTTIHYNVGKNDSLYHFHQQVELLYIEKGNALVIINDEKKNLKDGQLAIVDSFSSHQYIVSDNSTTHCLTIPVQYLKKYSSVMTNKVIKNQYITNLHEANRIFKCMKNVALHLKDNSLILDGYVSILLGNIIKNNLTIDKNKTDYDLIKSILVYIEENHKNSITLESIAKKFGYSKYYFSHVFNKCFHCNINDYINLVRCRYAINHVIDDHLSYSEAAFASGFKSMRTFYRAFKKNFNMTPNEYFVSKSLKQK